MPITRIIPDEEARRAQVSRWAPPEMGEPTGQGGAGALAQGGRESPGESHRLPTARELEAIRQAAHAEGHRAGFEQGYAEGLAQGQADGAAEYRRRLELAAAQAEVLAQMLDALAEPLALIDEQVAEQLTRLALAVARQIVHRELQTQPGEIMAVIREAVALLPLSARDVRVHVHPEDYRFLAETLRETEHGAWRLVEDAAIERGGCEVRSESSRVDASLTHRLNQLAAQLLGDGRQAAGGAGEGTP